jgi:hypothetical protein
VDGRFEASPGGLIYTGIAGSAEEGESQLGEGSGDRSGPKRNSS